MSERGIFFEKFLKNFQKSAGSEGLAALRGAEGVRFNLEENLEMGYESRFF